MTKQEFTERTGYYPTDEQFQNIHADYMAAGDNVDKDTFCARWKKANGILRNSKAAAIQIDLLQTKVERMEQLIEQLNVRAIELEGRIYEEAKAYSQALKEVEKWKGVVTAIKMSIPNE